ncbi:MAG: hypothetical protein QOJ85_1762, partial [Solirubrobacteraceae bacterium]|nr:hypothetical protein [Solirubrobacteraceae bacterium]
RLHIDLPRRLEHLGMPVTTVGVAASAFDTTNSGAG